MKFTLSLVSILILWFSSISIGCHDPINNNNSNNNNIDTTKVSDVEVWITSKDQTKLLQRQNKKIYFGQNSNIFQFIDVDSSIQYQSIDGFGFTLTGGSAQLINKMSQGSKMDLLRELFGNDDHNIGISYLRLSIGASDLNEFPFSYDDIPDGENDFNLQHFTLSHDTVDLIPVIKSILSINPNIKLLGSPWSAPRWMKTNNSFIGGSLKNECFDVYSRYFVKYIQSMKANGINLDAITIQNEPLYGGNNPSMLMTPVDQAKFIRENLGPEFEKNNINTKIIVYDHNCDRPDYPVTVMSDPQATKYIDGAAFHLYGGYISALSYIHDLFPTKNLYFTEQYTSSTGDFGGDLNWHIQNVIIGSMRNWSRVALEWNLANDPYFKPHTQGGCDVCKGAVTIIGADSYQRNVGYYNVAHASKFVPQGSKRIFSTQSGNISNVVFIKPDGQKVMIALNSGNSTESLNIRYDAKWATITLEGGEVGTLIWK